MSEASACQDDFGTEGYRYSGDSVKKRKKKGGWGVESWKDKRDRERKEKGWCLRGPTVVL